jgi:hypothetical protein
MFYCLTAPTPPRGSGQASAVAISLLLFPTADR